MPAVKRQRKRMKGEARRDQIVKVASRLFSKNGFRGTTTRAIARGAGISEAVIYRHFRRKTDLYKAIIDSKCTDESGQSLLMNSIKGKGGKEVFSEIALFLLNVHQQDPSFIRLLTFSALENQNLSKFFIKTKGLELIAFMKEKIKGLIRERVLRDADPEVAARAFLGMVVHFSVMQELYGLKRYFRKPNRYVARIFVDIFFDGMRRRV